MQDKSPLFISGGSGLLAINWAYTMREHYSVHLGLHNRIIKPAGVSVMETSLESLDDLLNQLKIIKPVAIIHTAGLTNVEICEENPELAQHVNVDLSSNIATASKILGIPLVHISTDHLYQGTQADIDESVPPNAINAYGDTKAKAEVAVLRNNGSALVIRTNFYGWGPSYRQSFSDRIISSLRKREEIILFNDVYYTPILAEPLILSVHELLERKAEGIFNVISDDRVSKFEFGVALAKEFNLDENYIIPGSFRSNAELVNRPADMSLSNSKVRTLLGRKIGTVKEHIRRLHQQETEDLVKEIQLL